VATKRDPGKFDCYAKAVADEPLFVLLARDRDAPGAVVEWSRRRLAAMQDGTRPLGDAEQVAEALKLVRDMLRWREQHPRPALPEAPVDEIVFASLAALSDALAALSSVL
jgi:hypothetical protein